MSSPKYNQGDKVVVHGNIGTVTRYLDAAETYFYQVWFEWGIDTMLYAEDILKPYKEIPDLAPLPFDALSTRNVAMFGNGESLISHKGD